MSYASSLSFDSLRISRSSVRISRDLPSMSRRCARRSRYHFASKNHEDRNHVQAMPAITTLPQATMGSAARCSGNTLTAMAVAASAAPNKDTFFMKDARQTRSFRRYRNAALSVIALSFLNGTLIKPAIAAIDVLVVLITATCLLLACLELSRKSGKESQS